MDNDEFKELFVTENEIIDKKLLGSTLTNFIKLTPTGELILETNFYNLSNTQKIIIYLLARKVLKIKKIIEQEEIGPTDLANSIGLAIGSVKSVFFFTKDNIFKSLNGKYMIPNYAITKAVEYITISHENKNVIKQKKNSTRQRSQVSTKSLTKSESIEKINEKLNRTDFPKIHELKGARDRSLYLLKICKENLDIDGLTPAEISYVLTEIFRIPTSKEAIGMILMGSQYVHRVKKNSTFIYKLMKPGEDYLNPLLK